MIKINRRFSTSSPQKTRTLEEINEKLAELKHEKALLEGNRHLFKNAIEAGSRLEAGEDPKPRDFNLLKLLQREYPSFFDGVEDGLNSSLFTKIMDIKLYVKGELKANKASTRVLMEQKKELELMSSQTEKGKEKAEPTAVDSEPSNKRKFEDSPSTNAESSKRRFGDFDFSDFFDVD